MSIRSKELAYKKRNRIDTSDNARYHQGVYYPVHPEKWVTKENIYRSSWEQKFMQYLDNNPMVVRCGSEPISIQYRNPIKNLEYCVKNGLNPQDPNNYAIANYWLDFWMEIKQSDGTVKKYFVEVKPYAETVAPKTLNESAKLRDKKKFNRQASTFLVNSHKWAAAKKFCQDRGCEFMIVTEKTLERLGLL